MQQLLLARRPPVRAEQRSSVGAGPFSGGFPAVTPGLCLQNYHIESTRSQRTVGITTCLQRLPRFILQDVRNSLTHNLICKDKATLLLSSKSSGPCCVSSVLSPGRWTAGRHLLLQLPEIFVRLVNIQLPTVLFAFLGSTLHLHERGKHHILPN